MSDKTNRDIKRTYFLKEQIKRYKGATAVCIAAGLILFIYLLFAVNFQYIKIEQPLYRHVFWGVGVYMMIVFFGAFVAVCYYHVGPTKLVAVLLPALAIAYMIVNPFGGVPDETIHITTSYRLTNYILGWEKPGETNTSTIIMRGDDARLTTSEDPRDNPGKTASYNFPRTRERLCYYWEQLWDPLEDATPTVANFATLDLKRMPIYEYVGPVIGIFVGRLLGLGTFSLYVCARVFTLILYTAIVTYTISILPEKKRLLMVILLSVTSVNQGMGITYDSLTNAICFLIAASMVVLLYFPPADKKRRNRYLIYMIIATAILVPCKSGGFLFFLLLPWYALYRTGIVGKKKFWAINIAMFAIGVAAVGWILMRHLRAHYDVATFSLFMSNALARAFQIIQTAVSNAGYYLRGVGINGIGASGYSFPTAELGFLLLFFIASVKQKNDTLKIMTLDRIVYIVLFLGTFIGLLTIFIYMTPHEWELIRGVQGRYLLPVIFPLLLATHNDAIQADDRIDILLAPGAVFFHAITIIYYMATRPLVYP